MLTVYSQPILKVSEEGEKENLALVVWAFTLAGTKKSTEKTMTKEEIAIFLSFVL
ncbi:hypothetical protein JW710_01150 [Candidatus Dojkabacteria bacterium]|nr:hypothetical protein [Candidatus Dojkabacteria bacterium]